MEKNIDHKNVSTSEKQSQYNLAHVWLDVDDADLPAVQDFLHRLNAGAIQIPFVVAILQKPGRHQTFNNTDTIVCFEIRLISWGSCAPVVINHVVKDFSAGEEVFSA